MLIIPYVILGKNMRWQSWGWLKVEVTSDTDGYKIRKLHDEIVPCGGTAWELCQNNRVIILMIVGKLDNILQTLFVQEL